MRIIDALIWRDDLFSQWDPIVKLIWIGIFSTVADDQGRFLNDHLLIRADLFPRTDIPIAPIDAALTKFIEAKRLYPYRTAGKSLLQIVNWWKHQPGTWMGASQYPAPRGWIDRVRYHGKGGGIITENWDQIGGFPKRLRSSLPSPLPSGLPSREGENGGGSEDRSGTGTEKGSNEVPNTPAGAPVVQQPAEQPIPAVVDFTGQNMVSKPVSGNGYTHLLSTLAADAFMVSAPTARDCEKLYQQVTGQITIPADKRDQAMDALQTILQHYGTSGNGTVDAGKRFFARWCNTKSRNNRPYSKTNTAWLNWWLDELAPMPTAPITTQAPVDFCQTGKDLQAKNKQAFVEHSLNLKCIPCNLAYNDMMSKKDIPSVDLSIRAVTEKLKAS